MTLLGEAITNPEKFSVVDRKIHMKNTFIPTKRWPYIQKSVGLRLLDLGM